jgi:hypothetical protein
MLRMPQRSITRFFIPMIDVLTLLFCIYLLMPLTGGPEDSAARAELRAREDQLRREERLRALERKEKGGTELSEKMRKEIEELRKARVKDLERKLLVRVLEINPKTGRLYYRDPERVEVRSQADARDLIERDRRAAGGRDLYYLIMYPRDPSSDFPTRGQRQEYDRWFEGVALGYDNPAAAPGGGGGR